MKEDKGEGKPGGRGWGDSVADNGCVSGTSPNDAPPNSYLLSTAFLGLILALHLALARHFYFLCDDAYISFRYLDNWLSGHGLVYNVGERVEGYTNFLWIVLLAPLVQAGLSPGTASVILSVGSSLALLILVWFITAEDITQRRKDAKTQRSKYLLYWGLVPLLAPLTLAANRSYAVWATSGLETRLFSLLVFLGLALVIRALITANDRPLILVGIVFGLAELTRPEAILLGGTAFGLFLGWKLIHKQKAPRKALLFGLGIFIVITAAHFGWRRVYYGDWLPNTFYVKVSGGWPEMGVRYLWMFGLEYGYWWWAPVMVFGAWRSWRAGRPAAPLLLLFMLPYLSYLVYVGGDHFEYRLLDPVLPALAVLMVIGAIEVVGAFSNQWTRMFAVAVLAVMGLYHVAFPLCTGAHRPERISGVFRPHADPDEYSALRYLPGLPLMADYYNKHYAALVEHAVGVRWEHHELAARELGWQADRLEDFFERGNLDRSESMCIRTAGIIPYATRMPTLDYYGLTNKEIARQEIERPAVLFHDKKASPEYLRLRGIDYIQYSDFVLDAGEFGGELPVLILKGHDRELIAGLFGRVYLVPMGETYFVFLSARTPDEIKERFLLRGLGVYEYSLRYDSEIMVPIKR